MPIERKCVTCGKVFYVSPSRLKRGDKCLYCSKTCEGKSRRIKYNVDNREFKEALKEFKNLMYWKAMDSSDNRPEITEELFQRYHISLYRILARKDKFKDWKKAFRVAMNYDTRQYWEELKKFQNEIPKDELYINYKAYENCCQDQRIDMKNYIRKICSTTLSKDEYFAYYMYLYGIENKIISGIYGVNSNVMSNRIDRKKKRIRKEQKEAYEYLQNLDYRL